MAKWYKTGDIDEVVEVKPKGKYWTLEELQAFVEGEGPGGKGKMVQIVPLPSGKQLVANEEGLLLELLYNEAATKVWKEEYPIKDYPYNNSEMLVGNVLITEPEYLEE